MNIAATGGIIIAIMAIIAEAVDIAADHQSSLIQRKPPGSRDQRPG
jgi:hypothetical protein